MNQAMDYPDVVVCGYMGNQPPSNLTQHQGFEGQGPPGGVVYIGILVLTVLLRNIVDFQIADHQNVDFQIADHQI
jgi:hypothetical protein